MMEALDMTHLLALLVGAAPGMLAMVWVAKVKARPDMMKADTERIQAMWDRLDEVEKSMATERKECQEKLNALSAELDEVRAAHSECPKKIEALREEIRIMRDRVDGMSEVEIL
jgi:septal ring factor EnvC (AmiA/AmiB activator)